MTGRDWIEFVSESLKNKIDKIEAQEEKLEQMKTDYYCLTAIMYEVDRVQSSCDGDKLAKQYAQIEEFEKRLEIQIKEFERYRNEILEKVYTYLPNVDLCRVVVDRHIFFMTNQEMSDELGITDRGIRKRFEKAYNLLNSIYVLEKYRKKFDSSDKKVVL